MDAAFDDHDSYLDFYSYVTFYAPEFSVEDYLSDNEQMDLAKAFKLLRYGLRFVRPRLSEREVAEAEELFGRAEEAFEKGPDAGGLQMLYDYEPKLFRRGA